VPEDPPVYGGAGTLRQGGLYRAGPESPERAVPVGYEALEAAARAKLRPEVYDYVAGGAGSEEGIRANREAFRRHRLLPRILAGVAARDLTVPLLGRRLPAPLALSPVAALSIVHPEAERAVARAARSLGLPFALSTVSSTPLEEVAEASGDGSRWFQLYVGKDEAVNRSLVERAERAGFEALLVTVDTPQLGWRERDLQNGYRPFVRGDGASNFLSDPAFLRKLARPPTEDREAAVDLALKNVFDPSFDWDRLEALVRSTSLPVLLKGVAREEDARRAVQLGVAGLIVSNHGGRQVDGGQPTIAALPGVVRGAGDRVPVLLDSGVRRGSDLLIALALGAKAVMIGRPYVWGLALRGSEGVREVVLNLLADVDLTLAALGRSRVDDLDASLLAPGSL
jgi:lactate 2-monooxygenase